MPQKSRKFLEKKSEKCKQILKSLIHWKLLMVSKLQWMDKVLAKVQLVKLNLKIIKKHGIKKSEKPMIEP
jgi:hypothetical protein